MCRGGLVRAGPTLLRYRPLAGRLSKELYPMSQRCALDQSGTVRASVTASTSHAHFGLPGIRMLPCGHRLYAFGILTAVALFKHRHWAPIAIHRCLALALIGSPLV